MLLDVLAALLHVILQRNACLLVRLRLGKLGETTPGIELRILCPSDPYWRTHGQDRRELAFQSGIEL